MSCLQTQALNIVDVSEVYHVMNNWNFGDNNQDNGSKGQGDRLTRMQVYTTFKSCATHFFHDTRLTLAKGRVTSQFVLDKLHLYFDATLGFLAGFHAAGG